MQFVADDADVMHLSGSARNQSNFSSGVEEQSCGEKKSLLLVQHHRIMSSRHRHDHRDRRQRESRREDAVPDDVPDRVSKSQLPQIPDMMYSSGGNSFADSLKDRVADMCFAILIILLVSGYVCARMGLDPLDAGETLDEHPIMKKAMATTLALVLGAVARRSQVAADLVDRTIGMAIQMKDMASGRV